MTQYILYSKKVTIFNEIKKFVEESRTREESVLGDVIIKCYDGNVYSHSIVLALYSGLFRLSVMSTEEEIVLYALDYSSQSVGYLLTLLYTGKVELVEKEIKILDELCDILGISKNYERSVKQNLIFTQEKNLSTRTAEAKSNRKKRNFTANLKVGDLTCDICFKVFKKLYQLKNHQLIHQRSFPFICSDCGKGFKNKYKLNAHEKEHNKHLIQPKLKKSGHDDEVEVEKSYPCKNCSMVFSKDVERRKHLKDNHKITISHSCFHCASKFRTKKNLIAHLRVVHNDLERVLQHICSVCDKRFIRPSHLEDHMARHNLVAQHTCMYCPKRCATKQDLDRHLASHKGENKHTCQLCFKSFVHRSTYTVHVRKHLGQKPYICKPCNKCFLQFKSLAQHQKVHVKRNDLTVLVAQSKSSRGLYSYIDSIPELPVMEDSSMVVAKLKDLPDSSQVYLPGPQYNKSTGFKSNQQPVNAPLKQQFITDYSEISRIGFQFPNGDTDGFGAIVEMESLFEPGPIDNSRQNILDEQNTEVSVFREKN